MRRGHSVRARRSLHTHTHTHTHTQRHTDTHNQTPTHTHTHTHLNEKGPLSNSKEVFGEKNSVVQFVAFR